MRGFMFLLKAIKIVLLDRKVVFPIIIGGLKLYIGT